MVKWFELLHIAESVHLGEEDDAIIWKWEAKGTYSVSSLYSVINFRGVIPVNIPVVWKLSVPPRLHVFMWLLCNNKLLTRDNLSKRQHIDDVTCVFCSDCESFHHLFYDCIVARNLWQKICEITKVSEVNNMLSVSRWWISDKNHKFLNIIHTAALWSLWRMRNDICFNRTVSSGMQVLYVRVAYTLAKWRLLCPEGAKGELDAAVRNLDALARAPPMLMWPEPG